MTAEEDFDIFWLLSAELRRNILQNLDNKKLTMKEILGEINKQNDSNTAFSQFSINFHRLRNVNLIKNNNNFYSLTTFGDIICQQIQSSDFISNNKQFLNSHDVFSLPLLFQQSLGSLSKGKLIHGTSKVKSHWDRIHESAEKYLKNILCDIPYDDKLMKVISDDVKKNVEIYSIFCKHPLFDDADRDAAIKKYQLKKSFQEQTIQRRIGNKTKISLCLNETEAIVMFFADEKLDWSEAFYSDDGNFHDWCEAVFHYYWNHSKPFKEKFWEK